MRNFKLLALAGLCGSLLFTSCEQEDHHLPNKQPVVQATIGEEADEPCSGTMVSEFDWSVLDDSPPAPFEISVLTEGIIPTPDPGCYCAESKVCITFNFDKSSRHADGHKFLKRSHQNGTATQEWILTNHHGDYVGHPVPPQFVAAASKVYRSQLTASEIDDWNVLCFEVTDTEAALMVDFGLDVPYDYDPLQPVESVIGLCIVDNIHDPSGE